MKNREIHKTQNTMAFVIVWMITGFIGIGVTAETFKIGGIFGPRVNDTKPVEQIMFEISTQLQDDTMEHTQYFQEVTLHPISRNIYPRDAIRTEDVVCSLLDESVIGIFGPPEKYTIPIVRSMSDVKEIPNIQARYDSHPSRKTCGINLYPHPSTFFKAYTDLIKKLGWSSFIILYEDNESLLRISGLLRPEKNLSVEIKQLPNTGNFRNVFRSILKSEQTNILLDCSISILPEVLKQAQQTGMMINKYNYIVTCLDLHTLDLEQYKYSGVRIIGLRLVNPSKSYVSRIISDITPMLKSYGDYEAENIQVEAALIFDAVRLYRKTLQEKYFGLPPGSNEELSHEDTKFITDSTVPRCFDDDSWKFGFSIINDLKIVWPELEDLLSKMNGNKRKLYHFNSGIQI